MGASEMRKTFSLAIVLAAALWAAEKLPAGAVRTGPYTWRHTDKEGKVWIYRETPFGLMKQDARYAPDAADHGAPVEPKKDYIETPFGNMKVQDLEKRPAGPALRVREEGGKLHFERETPFGVQKWTRDKTMLTPEEKKAWEQRQLKESNAEKR